MTQRLNVYVRRHMARSARREDFQVRMLSTQYVRAAVFAHRWREHMAMIAAWPTFVELNLRLDDLQAGLPELEERITRLEETMRGNR